MALVIDSEIRPELIGRKVRVYRNLNTKIPAWSVQDARTRLIITRLTELSLTEVTFKIIDTIQAKVRQYKRKEVHAFVCGTLCLPRAFEGTEITYNPYKYDEFVIKHNEDRVLFTDEVYMSPTMRVYANNLIAFRP